MISVWNRGREAYAIRPGDRIAQLVLLPIVRATLRVVDTFEESARGWRFRPHRLARQGTRWTSHSSEAGHRTPAPLALPLAVVFGLLRCGWRGWRGPVARHHRETDLTRARDGVVPGIGSMVKTQTRSSPRRWRRRRCRPRCRRRRWCAHRGDRQRPRPPRRRETALRPTYGCRGIEGQWPKARWSKPAAGHAGTVRGPPKEATACSRSPNRRSWRTPRRRAWPRSAAARRW